MVKVFAADGGNAKWKFIAPKTKIFPKKEDQFDHFFVSLTPQDFKRAKAREGMNTDHFYTVNGAHYMVGRKAARYGEFQQQIGEKRYNEQYYGVLAAIAMARGFNAPTKNIFFIGSHPPKDADYVDDLMAAVVKKWTVEWRDKTITLDVVDAATVDEPLCGWANVVFSADGKRYLNKTVNAGVTLVIDIGGVTTDGIVIDPNGEIDPSTADSAKIGILEAVDAFKDSFRSDYKTELKGVDLDDAMAHEALQTGKFNLRGLGVKDCSLLATEIKRELVARIVNFYDSFGGAANYDTLILDGGGAALLEAELREKIRHNNIILADKSADLHLANARGAIKWGLFNLEVGTYD